MVHWTKLPLTAIMFTHIDHDTGKNTVFWIDGLLNTNEYKKLETYSVDVDETFAKDWLPKRGLEPHRIAKLMRVPVEDFAPVTYAHMLDGSDLLIDGTHRYAAAYMRGAKTINAKIIKHNLWKRFIIEGLPDETQEKLQNSFSGLL